MKKVLIAGLLLGVSLAIAQAPVKPLEAKLKGMILPKVEFREASLGDVINHLSDTCRELDPEKRGANFVLKLPQGQTGEALPKVTLNLRNAPLYDVVRYVSELAGLSFRVEANAVLIGPRGELTSGRMETRSYRISPGALQPILQNPSAPQTPAVPAPTP